MKFDNNFRSNVEMQSRAIGRFAVENIESLLIRKTNMNEKNKLTWSISVFFLLMSAFGYVHGKQAHVNKSEDAIVERIDRVAAAEFKKLVKKNKNGIIKVLEENNVLPANLTDPYNYVSWHLYKSANMYIENGMGTAKIVLSGWKKLPENNYQRPVTLWFERKDGQWYLVVKNGHLTSTVSSSSEAFDLSSEIHEAFTRLFPHIEYEDWYKWKDPVRKKLAVMRLRSTLPHAE